MRVINYPIFGNFGAFYVGGSISPALLPPFILDPAKDIQDSVREPKVKRRARPDYSIYNYPRFDFSKSDPLYEDSDEEGYLDFIDLKDFKPDLIIDVVVAAPAEAPPQAVAPPAPNVLTLLQPGEQNQLWNDIVSGAFRRASSENVRGDDVYGVAMNHFRGLNNDDVDL